jgi:hypothetical protein
MADPTEELDNDDTSIGDAVASAPATAPAGAGAGTVASEGSTPGQLAAPDNSLSLPQLFHKCDVMFKRMDDLSGPKLEAACAEAVRDLGVCDSFVKRLGLFSKNEEVVDISTSHLKYLLIHFYLAKLVPRVFAPEPAHRLQHIRTALVHATHFTETCFRFSVMTRSQRDRWDALVKKDGGGGGGDDVGDGSSGGGGGGGGGRGGGGGGAAAGKRMTFGDVSPRAALSREDRIAAYKREKELKEYLAELDARRAGARGGGGGGGGAAEGEDEEEDEEEERKMYLARLELAVSTAFTDMEMMEREVEVREKKCNRW